MVRPWTACGHVCVAYHDDDERRALLTINLADALERGEKLVYFIESGSTDDVAGWLRRERLDAAPLLSREQLLVHPAERFVVAAGTAARTFDSARLIATMKREFQVAVHAGYTGVRV